MDDATAVVGRFAPSPTSDFHVGNLRTALLAWLFARIGGGRFLLRIEDVDQYRMAAARGTWVRQLEDLKLLGIDWDSEVIRQSERFDIYREYARRLDTYECFCSRREIAEASQAPHGDYRPYPGTCAHLTSGEREVRSGKRPPAIRVRADGASFTIHDRFAGSVTRIVDDFVLIRNDGVPAYNLASVVDDGLTGVTQVCRGADLLDSAPRQAWLATQFGFAVPEYVHVGMAVGATGERLAKRDGALTMRAMLGDAQTYPSVAESVSVDVAQLHGAQTNAAQTLGHAGALSPRGVFWMITDSLGFPRVSDARALLAEVRAHPALLEDERLHSAWRPVTG